MPWTPYSLNPSQSWQATPAYPAPQNLLFEVGSSLYYVTAAQIGSHPSFNLWIQKSTDAGRTWTTTYNGPKAVDAFAVVQFGTVIYIFGDDFFGDDTLLVYRYDTGSDTFLANGAASGIHFNTGFGGIMASGYSDGKILVSYISTSGTTGVSCAVYDSAANTWTSPALMDSTISGIYLVSQASDSVSGLTFVFVGHAGTAIIDCFPVSRSNVVGTSVLAVTLSGGGMLNFPFQVGPACISGGDIVLPYVDPVGQLPFSTLSTLWVVRSPISGSPSFSSPEAVENGIFPPRYLWTFEDSGWFGWSIVDLAGTLYAFYSVNATFNDDSTSQTTIYYRTSSTPGTWSGAAAVWTGPVPSSSLSLYPVALSAGGIGIIEAYVNPVLFNTGGAGEYNSLTVIYLAPATPLLPVYVRRRVG